MCLKYLLIVFCYAICVRNSSKKLNSKITKWCDKNLKKSWDVLFLAKIASGRSVENHGNSQSCMEMGENKYSICMIK